VVCDEDRIDYLVNFYSKSNRLSISIFAVIVIDLAAMPYQKHKATVPDSALCMEMNALEAQADNAKAHDLHWEAPLIARDPQAHDRQ
jgi:hypothetical protein